MRSRVHSRPMRPWTASSPRPPFRAASVICSNGVARLSLRLFSISSRASSLPGSSGMALRLEHGKALVGIENIALRVGGFRRPPRELVHRADETHPIEHFLLAAVFDRAQRPLPPSCIVAPLQCLI